MTIEELTSKRDEAKKEAACSYKKFSLLKDLYQKAEKDYFDKSKRFQSLDYQLALVDGRLKKIESHANEKKEKKQPELTLDQLKDIAMKLGIQIPIETVEEDLLEDSSDEA